MSKLIELGPVGPAESSQGNMSLKKTVSPATLTKRLDAMNELIFMIEEAPEGGYTARALGESIFTEADSLKTLHKAIRDAVRCHFDKGRLPKIIRLHFVREEVITA